MAPRKRSSRSGRTDPETQIPSSPHAGTPSSKSSTPKAGAAEAKRFDPPAIEQTVPAWSLDLQWEKRMFWFAAGLALLALILRVPSLTSRSLWFDELHTWSDAYWVPPEGRTHWLFFRIVAVFTAIFGRNELGLRVYPMLSGVAGVFLTTVWVWRVAGSLPAVLAGLALAVSPAHIEYSQEGRYYAPMVLFAVGAMWAAGEFFVSRDRKRWIWLAALGAFLWLGMTNHLTSTMLVGILGLWMAGCVVALPWGRRLAARFIIGAKPATKTRVVLIGLAMAVVAGIVLWRGWVMFSGHLYKLTFATRTPNVEFTKDFFLWNLRVFGAGMEPRAFLGWIAWGLYEIGFVAGLVWLILKRPAWAILAVAVIAITLFAVFAYPVTQSYAPKYIAFVYPLRIFCFAVGWSLPLAWVIGKIPALAPPRREIAAAGAMGFALLALAAPPLLKHYGSSKTPIRNALEWIGEHAAPAAPIVSYGHTNYDVEYYARRLNLNLDRFTILRWPSETGVTDMGMIRAAVPPSGDLYFLYGWPHDCPPRLREGLKNEFGEVARFRSTESRDYDSVVYKWKFGDWTIGEGRSYSWPLSEAAGEKPHAFYSLYTQSLKCGVSSADKGVLVIDGREVAMAKSDDGTSRSATLTISAGPHEIAWRPAGRIGAADRLAVSALRPLKITIPATQISARGWKGEMADAEYEGRHSLRFIKNNWVEYSLHLTPGALYEVLFTGYNHTDGASFLETRLNREFAGVVAFSRSSGEWTQRGFTFRARESRTDIRVRLISEIADGLGKLYPGVGAAIESIQIREIPDGAVVLRDDRFSLERNAMFIPPGVPAYTASASSKSVAPEWTRVASETPGEFDVKIIGAEDAEPDQGPRLQIHLKPPYDGALLSPVFPVVPGKLIYLRVLAEVDQIYSIGATLILFMSGADGKDYYLFPSEGRLDDPIDWDYIYRAFDGPNLKRFTFFTVVPEDAREAALGVMVWPKPVPLNTPRMTVTLHPPIAPYRNPDLVSREK